MTRKSFRNICISAFVVLWIFVFHYESLRYFYLEPFFSRPMPKVKFLFPPAGWIMFFSVDDQFATAKVYGSMEGQTQLIDPHDIFRTRPIGFDNIHRNIIGEVLEPGLRKSFCSFLKRKFPEFDNFLIAEVYYPSLVRLPSVRIERVAYQCEENENK